MHFFELLLIAIGLSMDAFAVSICKGLALHDLRTRHALTVGLYFGVFQALMPIIGYFIGIQFADLIKNFDHWIAFVLLSFIGGKMALESRKQDDEPAPCENSLAFNKMLLLAIATSIDALAVGISFAFLGVNIVPSSLMIGITTLVISMAGVKVGHIFGTKYKSRAELAGGLLLIVIGLKILIEHITAA